MTPASLYITYLRLFSTTRDRETSLNSKVAVFDLHFFAVYSTSSARTNQVVFKLHVEVTGIKPYARIETEFSA